MFMILKIKETKSKSKGQQLAVPSLKTYFGIVFCIFFLFGFVCKVLPQGNTNAVIEYRIFNNTAVPNTLNAILYVKNDITIYIPQYNTQKIDDEKQVDRHSSAVNADWRYVKIDHLNKRNIFFDEFGRNKFLVEDQYPLHNWTITTESKNISGYPCVKARTNYRGRVWEAWFTPDIPLPYGPWKLCGLPGLIIEAKDDTGTYTLRVEKIEYRKDPVFDKDFASLVQTRNTEPIPIKTFIHDSDEYYLNGQAEMKKRWPDGVYSPINLRRGYELKYEWEE